MLISTYDLRLWMGVKEGDNGPNAKLLSIAKAVEDFVDSYTNRKIEAQVYRTNPEFCYLDGNGCQWIYAPQSPVSYVAEVAIDSDRVFDSSSLLNTSDFFWYPSGKIYSEDGYFVKGRRNVRLDYIAGYAPVVGGTHNYAVSTYPIPLDLHQTMKEMCVESFKEGMTAIHTVPGGLEGEPKFIQMLNRNSFWKKVLDKYKNFSISLTGND